MGEPLWTFEGYVTGAGAKVIEEWFHGELNEDERDSLRDRMNYLEKLERNSWVLPSFGPAGAGLWEIRRDTKSGWIRIYGLFHPHKRHCFVMLNGSDKNVKNDRKGKKLSLQRLKLWEGKVGSTHVCDFAERLTSTG